MHFKHTPTVCFWPQAPGQVVELRTSAVEPKQPFAYLAAAYFVGKDLTRVQVSLDQRRPEFRKELEKMIAEVEKEALLDN